MPYNMKKAGKKYRKGGSKRKQEGGGADPVMRAVRDEWTPQRDSIFVSNNGKHEYLTTDPRTGLPKRGPDPLSPQQRLEQMAIKNRRTDVDYENYLEDKRMREFYEKRDADRMVDEIIMDDIEEQRVPETPDDWYDDKRTTTTMPEPPPSDWKILMDKKGPRPPFKKGPVYGEGKMGPGYRRGGVLKRGGSVKKGAQGRNGVL